MTEPNGETTDEPELAAATADSEAQGAPSGRKTVRWIALGLAVACLGLWAVLATSPPATTRLATSPLVGKAAPSPATRTIDGETFRLSNLRGKWVLVNFFATWCVPCRVEHPDLVRFEQRHASIGDAAVVGVVYDDSAEAVRAFRDKEGGEWPMIMDPDGKMALDFGVRGVPESFLVDPTGVIVARIVGGVRAGQLEELLGRAQSNSSR